MIRKDEKGIITFNSPVEIGLRALTVLNDAFPTEYSLERLVFYDYLLVHSDDIPGGPVGLHPKTPHRSNEILVRRQVLQEGLMLYQSRGLIEKIYLLNGVFYSATETSSSFLDSLYSDYLSNLRDRASWVTREYRHKSDIELNHLIYSNLGHWGAEFLSESILWTEVVL